MARYDGRAMSNPIKPQAGVERRKAERRQALRRQGERRKGAKLPVAAAKPGAPEEAGTAAFAAQLMGQDGIKRGLRGGPPVLEEARAAYLGAEWTGPADRRRGAGKTAKTDI
jgi:hypothetical protein